MQFHFQTVCILLVPARPCYNIGQLLLFEVTTSRYSEQIVGDRGGCNDRLLYMDCGTIVLTPTHVQSTCIPNKLILVEALLAVLMLV